MRRSILIGAIIAPLALMGGCALLVQLHLLPERYAVNAPLGHLLFGRGIAAPGESAFGGRIRAATGFNAGLFAEGIPGARFLRFTESGDLLVSVPRRGQVVLLERDQDGDGRSDGRRTLLEELNRPHGLDFHEGWLYVAEMNAIRRVRFDAEQGRILGTLEHVVTGLPEGGNHWTRTVRFGPDGWLYVSVGSSCNVCDEKDPRRAAILRYRPDGSGEEIFATGLRNAVGFDWQPSTGDLYATDNGRDLLGDDFPPCELNRVVSGGFYGWPVANGDRVRDPDLGAERDADVARSLPPAHGFRAHNAPLGITFVRNPSAPPAIRGAALVALHGSWNRTDKDGYKVVSLHWQPDGSIQERDFLVGFLKADDVIGRPVDVAEGPDGALYVSDDYAGAVYRVAFGSSPAASDPAAHEATLAVQDPLAAFSRAERRDRSERGEHLFEFHACATCHDPARAAPGVVAKELTSLSSRYRVEDLERFLETPTPPMPTFPLSDGEKRDLAVHLLTRFP